MKQSTSDMVFAKIVEVEAIFGVHTLTAAERTRQLRNERLVYYQHPCVVIKVDNRGCEAELEMRTEVAVSPDGEFL